MKVLPTEGMLDNNWVLSVLVKDHVEANSFKMKLLLSIVDRLFTLFGFPTKVLVESLTVAIVSDPDDDEIRELELHDPNGLHLSEGEYEKLKIYLTNLYDWVYDKLSEQPVPEHCIKFENIIDACDTVGFNPDPFRQTRMDLKRKGL